MRYSILSKRCLEEEICKNKKNPFKNDTLVFKHYAMVNQIALWVRTHCAFPVSTRFFATKALLRHQKPFNVDIFNSDLFLLFPIIS